MQENIEELTARYKIPTEKQFQEYKSKVILEATLGKKPAKAGEEEILVIVGGQAGAGKSRLVAHAANELGEKNAVIVDFDVLRSLNPSYEEVTEKYSEITHLILYEDTERVKNELLEYLIENGYHVIYEGAMRNTQGFINFAQKFRDSDYRIKLKIMAVPELESYGSTLMRYSAALITDEVIPRWVEKYAHDESYVGVIRTVEEFQRKGLVDDLSVYVRSNEAYPMEIYSTEGRQFESPTEAILSGRESKRKEAVDNFNSNYRIVRDILEEKQPQLLPMLEEWKAMYEAEREHFESISDKTKTIDK